MLRPLSASAPLSLKQTAFISTGKGVRVNESQDDDALYTRTNAVAHELDPSRSTSGVRFILQSHLLEDVYAYNDFSHTGDNPGVRKKKDVTPVACCQGLLNCFHRLFTFQSKKQGREPVARFSALKYPLCFMYFVFYATSSLHQEKARKAEHRGMAVIREFSDEGKSGKNTTDRPDFTRMIDRIAGGNPDKAG